MVQSVQFNLKEDAMLTVKGFFRLTAIPGI